MSRTRTLQRQIIRNRAETEAAPKRAKLRAKRKKPTDELPIDRNVVLFKKAWDDFHYPSIEVKDKKGNITTTKKRKPIKKKRYFLSGKALVARMNYDKSIREKIAEKFRGMKEKHKAEVEAKKKEKANKKNNNKKEKE